MIEGMFSIIIPINREFKVANEEYEIDNFIASIKDQDYTNYEIIVVTNGTDREEIARRLTEKYIDSTNIYVYQNEEPSAPAAKNIGLKHAKGEFHIFAGCDTLMYPGTLTKYVMAFEENPEAAIIYSDVEYLFNGESCGESGSFPLFDRYTLLCYPYIDGTSPIRAKYSKPWDERIKALQDWGWSINCTSEAPAVKIRGIYYGMEKPRPGGIGEYFAEHWDELVNLTREIYNIPKRDVVVASIGAVPAAIEVAKALDADYLPPFMLYTRPHNYKVIYLLGYFAETLQYHNDIFKQLKRDGARIIHFIGTDIVQMKEMSWETNQNLVETLPKFADAFLTMSYENTAELDRMGLKTEVLPHPFRTDLPFIPEENPEEFTVGIYANGLDSHNARKYNIPLMVEIAKLMPDTKFKLFGFNVGTGHLAQTDQPNVEIIGRLPIEEAAKKITCYLRFPFHDGLGITSIQMMIMGKPVINSCVMIPGAYFLGNGNISSYAIPQKAQEIKYVLDGIKDSPSSIEERKKIREGLLKRYDQTKVITRLKEIFAEALEKSKVNCEEYDKTHPKEVKSANTTSETGHQDSVTEPLQALQE